MDRSRICVSNAYSKENAITYYPIVIIGAGESGIAMAYQLKVQLGFDQFRLFDRQSGIGGTWWANRYPGIACDVPAAFYSFSFAPNYTAKRLFPSGSDFVEYLYQTVSKFALLDKVQLDTEVSELRWNKETYSWDVSLAYLVPGAGDIESKKRQAWANSTGFNSPYLREERIKAGIVISCAGILVEPNTFPREVSGYERFQGQILHSSRWPESLSLCGKDVVVVGSGCSAAQIVPAMLGPLWKAKSVTQIIRTPPYIEPRLEELGGKQMYAIVAPKIFRAFPVLGFALRSLVFSTIELLWCTVFQKSHTWLRTQKERSSLKHMRSLAPKKYHLALTPTYSYGCKRRIFDQDWLRSMNDNRFQIVTDKLMSLESDGVIVVPTEVQQATQQKSSSSKISADVIVLATGFEATEWLHPLKVFGCDARSLHDVWQERGGPQAYMGVAMDGFPNLFFVLGPNTACGHSSFILASENAAGYISKMIRPILQGDAVTVEVKKEAEMRWSEEIQRRIKDTVFFSGCRSWYQDSSGWNSTMYP